MVAGARADFGFDALLPAALQEQTLLWREAQLALVPLAVLKHAQLFKQLARKRHAGIRHGDVVRCPWKRRDFVFAPTRISAGLRFHFNQHEIGEAFFAETPRGAEAG